MGKRFPRAPSPKPPRASSSGRTVKHGTNGGIIEEITIRGREIHLHATKGLRNYRA